MGCRKNVRWVITTFECNDCGNLFTMKHRPQITDKIRHALSKTLLCSVCSSKNFSVKGTVEVKPI